MVENRSKNKILVLDDEPHVVTYLETLLQDNGCDAMSASNGEEGMEKAKAGRPDLVCLDITMPGQSGIRFYRNLKEDPDLKAIPVIVVTAVTGYGGIPSRSRSSSARVNRSPLPKLSFPSPSTRRTSWKR